MKIEINKDNNWGSPRSDLFCLVDCISRAVSPHRNIQACEFRGFTGEEWTETVFRVIVSGDMDNDEASDLCQAVFLAGNFKMLACIRRWTDDGFEQVEVYVVPFKTETEATK